MEVIQERLEREFNLDLVTTAPERHLPAYTRPTARWCASTTRTTTPTRAHIEHAEEPYRQGDDRHAARLRRQYHAELCQDTPRRVQGHDSTSTPTVSSMHYEMPLNEIIYDFFDALKSHTKGYASSRLRALRLPPESSSSSSISCSTVTQVDALSFIAHKDKAYARGEKAVRKAQGQYSPPAL